MTAPSPESGSRLEQVLASGTFAVTAELGPPKTDAAEVVRTKASYLQGVVHAVNITDNQTAIVRMSSIAAGVLARECGLEPVIQMTCRDRNRLAIQSDMLGASALGIRNILCLSGDHQSFGNHPGSKNVYDMDSIQLVGLMKQMRDENRFECGEEIKNRKKDVAAGPRLFIGAAANPFGDPFVARVVRLAKKVAAGADFIQTQPVFDLARFEKWLEAVRARGLDQKTHILAGVMPVKSYRAFVYMNENVPGITIPEELVTRMQQAEDPKEEGVRICVEMIQRLREMDGVHGVHIMAVEWEQIVSEVVNGAGLSL